MAAMDGLSVSSLSTPVGGAPTTVARLRQKRSQVARACDACRVQRIKCDNSQPCTNCQTRGRQCSNSDAVRTTTLTQAQEEISRLKATVRELEDELRSEREKTPAPAQTVQVQGIVTPPSSNGTPTAAPARHWQGVVKQCASRSPNESWFGPSSIYYFVKRLDTSLSNTLRQPQPYDRLQLCSESSSNLLEGPSGTAPTTTGAGTAPPSYLTPMQEQYFIDLFWDSFHTCVVPILDEADFKQHHQSLWTTASTRRPSALVDIVVAMCMQLGISTMPAGEQGRFDNTDPTIAGRMHYRRCQTLLAHQVESPSLATLKCHILCAIYLCSGSFHNMVDAAVAQAVRTAYVLGLHMDAPPDMPRRDVERRRRLWWAVYLMETKIGTKLGRPFSLRDSHVMPEMPADDFEAAMLSGSRFAPIGDGVTWLSFNRHHVGLHATIRRAYLAFYDRDTCGRDMWDDTETLEDYARLLQPHNKALDDWVAQVPQALTTRRVDGGKPLSVHPSRLDIEQFAPLWLQRQRLLLEIAYHNISVLLYRPFISFSAAPGPLATEMASRCASHAIALTRIAHQVLSTMTILDGWHEVFHWQWGVSMTLVGFLIAYPSWEQRDAVREAIDCAVGVFDKFSKRFAVAGSAASIMRELCVKVDLLKEKTQPPVLDLSMTDMGLAEGTWDGPNFFDVTFNVDFWGGLDTLWPGSQEYTDPSYLGQY